MPKITFLIQNTNDNADSGGSEDFRDAVSDLSLDRSGSDKYLIIVATILQNSNKYFSFTGL